MVQAVEKIFLLQNLNSNWWLLESTAPLEVDQPAVLSQDVTSDPQLELDRLVDALVQRVQAGGDPNLTIFSHGYSNNLTSTLDRITKAKNCTSAHLPSEDLFWIGYRWPSETIGSVWRSPIGAAHPVLRLVFGLALVAFVAFRFSDPAFIKPAMTVFAFLAYGLVAFLIGFVGLRASVYYRDTFRAVNFGALDLVEFVRQLDKSLAEKLETLNAPRRINLSFVGHSMGGLVVTTAIRIFSDVFAPGATRAMGKSVTPPQQSAKPSSAALPTEPRLSSENLQSIRAAEVPAEPSGPSNSLGRSLSLLRFVLVSPDVPALALVSGRANFLGPSIRRCSEAYLVSNGGDVVLGLISICANYLVFPAQLYGNSARLGNVQIVSDKPGFFDRQDVTYQSLRVGPTTLAALERSCGGTDASSEQIARCFTLVDCTGFRETANGPQRLSNLKGTQAPWLGKQLLGTCSYVAATLKLGGRDCHSGYFDFDTTLLAIFGCAGVGLLGLRDQLVSPPLQELVTTCGLRISPGDTLGAIRPKEPFQRS
jgi:hypothetical protein